MQPANTGKTDMFGPEAPLWPFLTTLGGAADLFQGTDGTLVAMASGYPSIDSTRKIITFDPASNLTSATAYIIAYAVVDIYGQSLTGVVNFTTT